MDPKEELRKAIHDDLTEKDHDCPQCASAEFEIDVWGVGDGIRGEEVRAVAVCSSCSARLNVPVDDDVFDEIL